MAKTLLGACRPAQCVHRCSKHSRSVSLDSSLVLMSAFYYHKQPEQCFRVSIFLFLGLCAGISFSIHCSPNALGTCVIKIDWSRKMLKIYFSTTLSPAWKESEGKNVKSQRGMFNFKTSRGNARVNVNWNGMSWLEVALKWLHFQFAASE